MRDADTFTESPFTMRELEDFVPARRPLREIRKTANAMLEKLASMLTAMYAAEVREAGPAHQLPLRPHAVECLQQLSTAF